MVAALYVAKGGAERDARLYAGPHPGLRDASGLCRCAHDARAPLAGARTP
jgi:hypothetical protein